MNDDDESSPRASAPPARSSDRATPADMSVEPSAGTRAGAWRALTIVWLVNTVLASLLGTAYFGDALEGASLGVRAFAAAALVSSLATVTLVGYLPLFGWLALAPRARGSGWFVAAWSTVLLVLVFADTRIYGLFRYHFNGMVWNLLTTPGGTENFQITPGTYVGIGVVALITCAAQRGLWTFVTARPRRPVLRYALPALLAIVVGEKVTYAVADARRDRGVTARAALFPLYQRFTMKKTLARWIDVETGPDARVEVAGAGLLLRYPLATPDVPVDGARPNVLIVVIDSLRADALTPTDMPRVTDWSGGARVFQDHASGGNATRFGVFSLVYGIHGTYWMPVYEEKAPPVLVTALDRAGYELRVISAAKMSYPEFRSTAWVTMENRVDDGFEQPEKFQRDAAVADHFESWLADRDARQAREPFFCFILLDSPHQTYSWPPEETHYQPAVRSLDYVSLARRPSDETIATVRNSYRNAVRYADRTTGRLLDSLAAHGVAEDTVVIVTGDHGEEFWEHGYFGHTSNFTPEQVHVAFVMRGPGVPVGVETRPTSHVDVAPTILEMLGVDPRARATWSQGENLLAPPERRDRVVAGWQEVAVWVEGGILHVPLEGHRGLVEARDRGWKLLEREREFLDAHGAAIGRLALDCRRFLK